MPAEHFLLIESDIHSQRLVIAWPEVDYVGPDTLALYEEWGMRANVPLAEVMRCAPLLFSNAICEGVGDRDFRESDADVVQFIRASMLRRIAGTARAPRRTPAPPTPTTDDN